MSKEGLAMLASLEGICLSKYKDSVGVWTIGVGATRTEIKDIASWPKSRKITIEEAFELLKKSIVRYENGINRHLKREIPQHQFDALVSWCYNVGVGWVRKSTIMRLINKGVKSKARLRAALMMYKKPPEIQVRRRKEARLLTDGVYSGRGKANVFPVSKSGRPMYSKGYQVNVLDYIKEDTKPKPQTIKQAIKKVEEEVAIEEAVNVVERREPTFLEATKDYFNDLRNIFKKKVDKEE